MEDFSIIKCRQFPTFGLKVKQEGNIPTEHSLRPLKESCLFHDNEKNAVGKYIHHQLTFALQGGKDAASSGPKWCFSIKIAAGRLQFSRDTLKGCFPDRRSGATRSQRTSVGTQRTTGC